MEVNGAGAERMAEIVRELSYAGGAKSAKIPLLDYLSSELRCDSNNACGSNLINVGDTTY